MTADQVDVDPGPYRPGRLVDVASMLAGAAVLALIVAEIVWRQVRT